MSGNVIYVGIDVDDVQYHGSALDRRTGEILSFHCRATLKGLFGQLDKVRKHFDGIELKLCYEASYVGFSLQRELAERGYPCEVVSPSSIPRRAGKAVKTDRIDAAELAEYYANGLFSVVAEPDAEIEQDRDLLRSRQRLIQQQGDLRRHILSLLRRNGLHYKAACASKTHWRTHHYGWLDRTIADCTGSLKVNLSLLLRQLKNLDEILAAYGVQVEALAVNSRYEAPVKALTCYKGIKHLFALTMITEIGDVKRFAHPRQLVSWAGMDIREYASGGKSNRLGITRQGNRYLRTALIEANQRGYRSGTLGKDVKARRAKSRSEYVAIADRCLQRLNRKGNRLLLAGKHPNKVKVACAREMVGFVWESLNQAAAA
jgi:transposase